LSLLPPYRLLTGLDPFFANSINRHVGTGWLYGHPSWPRCISFSARKDTHHVRPVVVTLSPFESRFTRPPGRDCRDPHVLSCLSHLLRL